MLRNGLTFGTNLLVVIASFLHLLTTPLLTLLPLQPYPHSVPHISMSHDDLDTQKNRTIAEPNPIITAAAVAGIGGGGAIQNMTSSLTTTGTTIASSFVKKLFDMVENESDEIIVWVANGTAFEVKDPKRLEIEILPNFFRHGRFQSLVRQLNFYAFKVLWFPSFPSSPAPLSLIPPSSS